MSLIGCYVFEDASHGTPNDATVEQLHDRLNTVHFQNKSVQGSLGIDVQVNLPQGIRTAVLD